MCETTHTRPPNTRTDLGFPHHCQQRPRRRRSKKEDGEGRRRERRDSLASLHEGEEEGEDGREALFPDGDAGAVGDYDAFEEEEEEGEEDEQEDGKEAEGRAKEAHVAAAPSQPPQPSEKRRSEGSMINVLGYKVDNFASLVGRRGPLRTGVLPAPLGGIKGDQQRSALVQRAVMGVLAAGGGVEGRRAATLRCVCDCVIVQSCREESSWACDCTDVILMHRMEIQACCLLSGGGGSWPFSLLLFFLPRW